MKDRIAVFFTVSIVLLAIVPLANVWSARDRKDVDWTDPKFLYNADVVSAFKSRMLLPFAISPDPQRVTIGHDRWLFLGDMHQNTLSTDRRPATPDDTAVARRIDAASRAWKTWLGARGVRTFRVMVAPNKGSVYPELMPGWARPVSPNGTDTLFAEVSRTLFIDLRPLLLAERPKQSQPLYYSTDTHWNFLGAGLAFRAFAREVGHDAPELRWPTDQAYAVARVDAREGGDLARFLRIPEAFKDPDPLPQIMSAPIRTTRYDHDTGKQLFRGGNPPVDSSHTPLRVHSEGALNRKKVLWLRDSFGQMMAPMMAVTFSDVIQMHWDDALKPDLRLAQLVETWKPDYVFITVTERASRDPKFMVLPPIAP